MSDASTTEAQQGSQAHEGAETWSNAQYSLLVTQKDGFFCTIRLAAVLDLPPDEAFALLARPDSHKVFRSITDNTYRKVIRCRCSDSGREVMQVETEARARWKLGVLRGSFDTRLMVDLHAPNGTIDFKLTRQKGMMKAFEGHWKVRSWDGSRSLDSIVRAAADDEREERRTSVLGSPFHVGPHVNLSRFSDWVPSLWRQHGGSSRQRRRCLLTLEQSLMPSLIPPGPLGGIVRGITAAQVRGMLSDLQAEVRRINGGASMPPSLGVQLSTEFGFPGCNSSNSSKSTRVKGSSSNRLGPRGDSSNPGTGNSSGRPSGRGCAPKVATQAGSDGQAGVDVSVTPTWLRGLDNTPLMQPLSFLAARNQHARQRRRKWLSDVGF